MTDEGNKEISVTLKMNHARFIYTVLTENVSVSGRDSAQQLVEMIDAFEEVLESENL